MKKLILLSLILFSTTTYLGAIDFFHGTWEEAIAKAKADKKLLFVDAYTSWCGPCKLMSSKIFPDPEVSAVFNENFINLKIDMEKGEGPTIRRKYGVSAYPTLLFLDAEGNVLHRKVGVVQAAALASLGTTIMQKHNRSADYQAIYEKNPDQSAAFMITYLQELNKANEETAKIANQYLRDHSKLALDSMIHVAFHGTEHANSNLFEILTKNSDIVKTQFSKELSDRLTQIADRTLEVALDFDSPEMLSSLAAASSLTREDLQHLYEVKYYVTTKNYASASASALAVSKKSYDTQSSILQSILELDKAPEELKAVIATFTDQLVDKSQDPVQLTTAWRATQLLEEKDLIQRMKKKLEKVTSKLPESEEKKELLDILDKKQ